ILRGAASANHDSVLTPRDDIGGGRGGAADEVARRTVDKHASARVPAYNRAAGISTYKISLYNIASTRVDLNSIAAAVDYHSPYHVGLTLHSYGNRYQVLPVKLDHVVCLGSQD